MKGLRLYLAPFAPDDSGAAAVLYPLGGLVVICDAGGCAGNICGFDEPRWGQGNKHSAVFSAGLRDMDAIMGRDDKLLAKMQLALKELKASFAAIIGTPVPAVIGTDFRALSRMGKKRLGLPTVTIPTTGTHLYDEGVSATYLALLNTFATPHDSQAASGQSAAQSTPASQAQNHPTSSSATSKQRRILGVWGTTPLELADLDTTLLRQVLATEDWDEIRLYGMDSDLAAYQQAAHNTQNLVYSPAGLAAAQWLNQQYGTPCEIRCPLTPAEQTILQAVPDTAKNILIIHQQYKANACRTWLKERLPHAKITCATWFMQDKNQCAPQDIHFKEEDDFQQHAKEHHYDIILGDPAFHRAIPKDNEVTFIDLPHFAVSGDEFIDTKQDTLSQQS